HGSTSLAPQELTPQANRRGGILKPGRTRREAPARLHLPPAASPEHTRLAHISVRTPQGPGRFTEYVASTPAQEAGADDSRIPVISRSGSSRSTGASTLAMQTKDAPVTPLPAKGSGRSRQVRSARAARKCVRFPEEQRLLETIRLIDPRTAQSIEDHAARSGLAGAEDVLNGGSCPTNAPLPESSGSDVPPAFNSGGSVSEASNNSPQQQQSDSDAEDQFDVDNIFADTPDASSCKSPDKFGTATSLLFDEDTDQPIPQPAPDYAPSYRRPPIPPPAHYKSCVMDNSKELADSANKQDGNELRKVLRCKDAVFFDHAVLSPTLAAMAHGFAVDQHNTADSSDTNDDDSDGALSVSFEDALSEIGMQQQQFGVDTARNMSNGSVANVCDTQNPLALTGLGM
ncbi:hypothetical protein H4R20_006958, partial [Coemansia guatemalensis]